MIKDAQLQLERGDARIGFEWSHRERNRYLTPTRFPLEIADFHDMTASMMALVLGLENAKQPDWKFQSLLTNNTDAIVAIYTNPLRSKLTDDTPPITDFVCPQFLNEHGMPGNLYGQMLKPYLTQTDYEPTAYAGYNDITIERKAGLLRRKRPHAVYQSGVAYIDVGLITRDEYINIIRDMIALGEAMQSPLMVEGSRKDLEEAKAQRPYLPKKLFK